MTRWFLALCGGVGGAVPALLAASQDLTGPTHGLGHAGYWLSWTLGVLMAFVIGGFVAGISKESIPWKAFVLGISLPGLITSLQANGRANSLTQWQPGQTQVSSTTEQPPAAHFASSAMAQSDAHTFVVSGLPQDTSGYAVLFFGAGGGQIGTEISLSSGSDTPRPVPPGATGVALRGPQGWSLPAPIDKPAQNGVLKLRAHAKSDFIRGFSRAFGGSGAPYEIEAQ